MKLYDITIEPLSPMGTVPKGDTLFGQFCWQVAHDSKLADDGLSGVLQEYGNRPFVVFSSAFPKIESESQVRYYFPRPLHTVAGKGASQGGSRKSIIENRKLDRARKWMEVFGGKALDASSTSFLTDEAVGRILLESSGACGGKTGVHSGIPGVPARAERPHNSINRMTGTTGSGTFAPYTTDVLYYLPGMKLAVFVLIDESATDIDRVVCGLERIGMSGFGRDASTGMGRFRIDSAGPVEVASVDHADAMYALAPVVPEKGQYRNFFFTPFVRFGRHGDQLASSRVPFKKPVVMADEGAVLVPGDKKQFERPWLGTAVKNVSRVQPETVAQGYAPWLPITLELSYDTGK